jgi:two-component system, chemotaxis family, sensor histidine kinase and response regulator PixL
MTSEQERLVKLQFLEEAVDYLDNIETGLVGLGAGQVTGKQLDAIMRAAHSIKGGAAMMGYTALSKIGHRLEDFFKILQYSKKVGPDAEVERLMFVAVDRLRQTINLNQKGKEPDAGWVQANIDPVMESLQAKLGDFNPEDEANMLSSESGEDILSFLFESEVETAIVNLETLVESGIDTSQWKAELEVTAEELGGLAEMVELPALGSLCQSILTHIETNPTEIDAVVRESISTLRRTQAMVLIGQTTNLPDRISLFTSAEIAPDETFEYTVDPDSTIWSADLRGMELVEELTQPDLRAFDINPDLGLELELDNPSISDFSATPPADLEMLAIADIPTDSFFVDDFAVTSSMQGIASTGYADDEITDIFATIAEIDLPEPSTTGILNGTSSKLANLEREAAELLSALNNTPEASASDVELIGDDESSGVVTAATKDERTIRVSVKQLEDIGDIFGELTIERNGLNLQLHNLRELVGNLANKVQQLEQSNLKLRTSYDRASSAHAQTVVAVGAGSEISAPVTAGVNYGDFDLLEFDRYSEQHLLSQDVMDTIVQVQEITADIDLQLYDTERTNRNLNRTAKEIQTGLTQVRMRPISDLLSRYPRAMRSMSIEHQKPVEVSIHGGSTLVERSILESLNDPLMHILRNAFDHGIEPSGKRKAGGKPEKGTIAISAGYRGNQTVITIEDDGGGIDLDKIRAKVRKMGVDEKEIANFTDHELLNLIFEPGFSTADKVTDLSGRGVGMDVVKTNIRELRGDISIDTELGIGTKFTITVPLTLSVVRVLIVDVGGMWMAIPSNMVEEIVLLDRDATIDNGNHKLLQWEELTLRLIEPARYLYHSGAAITPADGSPNIDLPLALTIDRGNELIAFQVDRFWGEQEVAIRQPQGGIKLPPGFTGCTIMGDGRIVPLIDAIELINSIEREGAIVGSNSGILSTLSFDTIDQEDTPTLSQANSISQRATVLIVDDSINVRRFVALTLEKAGYKVEQAKDGQEAVDKLAAGLRPQAVVCDIEMPRMDGYGFLAAVKGKPDYKDLPVMMLTSRSGEKHRKIAMNLGATAYFSKPFKEVELLESLAKYIKR